jgi:hypothetical protein
VVSGTLLVEAASVVIGFPVDGGEVDGAGVPALVVDGAGVPALVVDGAGVVATMHVPVAAFHAQDAWFPQLFELGHEHAPPPQPGGEAALVDGTGVAALVVDGAGVAATMQAPVTAFHTHVAWFPQLFELGHEHPPPPQPANPAKPRPGDRRQLFEA